MFKKFAVLFLIVMLAVVSVAAMAEEELQLDPDYPVFDWERDAQMHWQLDENGEAINEEAHVLNEFSECDVCGSELWIFDDGCVDVYNYNEYYDSTRITFYDEMGEATYDCLYAYGYDEEGNKQWEKQFENMKLVAETVFALNEEGENHPVWSASYYEDGTSARNEYDEHGNCVKAFTYDEEGAITYECTSEYALNEDGWYYEVKSVAQMGSTLFIDEYNEYGDRIHSQIIEADVVLLDATHEYGYENGMKLWSKDYMDGVLVGESLYDEDGWEIQYTEYFEDGAKSVYEYDENGDLAVLTWYTADGAVDYVESFTYVYDEDGLTAVYTYRYGVLAEEERYGLDEDGFLVVVELIEYDEDGNGTSVYTYEPVGNDN